MANYERNLYVTRLGSDSVFIQQNLCESEDYEPSETRRPILPIGTWPNGTRVAREPSPLTEPWYPEPWNQRPNSYLSANPVYPPDLVLTEYPLMPSNQSLPETPVLQENPILPEVLPTLQESAESFEDCIALLQAVCPQATIHIEQAVASNVDPTQNENNNSRPYQPGQEGNSRQREVLNLLAAIHVEQAAAPNVDPTQNENNNSRPYQPGQEGNSRQREVLNLLAAIHVEQAAAFNIDPTPNENNNSIPYESGQEGNRRQREVVRLVADIEDPDAEIQHIMDFCRDCNLNQPSYGPRNQN